MNQDFFKIYFSTTICIEVQSIVIVVSIVSTCRHLVECLVDAGKGKEASSFAKATSDFIESHIPDLYPKIFSLQVKPRFFFFLCAD